MKLSDYVVSFLEKKSIKDIFTLSGGFCLPLIDSISKSNINYICNLHEQAAAIGAEAYAQYNNTPGVCLVTAGPGGTNTVTGVASAWLDSIPIIFLSGQVQSKDINKDKKVRQIGFQEIDMPSIVKSITKYSTTVLDPYDIKKVLEEAWCLATTGRPGPVWIEIPLDIQSFDINIDQLKGFNPPSKPDRKNELKQKVNQFYNLLNNSNRPVILAGNGIRLSKAEKSFIKMIETLNIPVLTTWKALDMIEEDHPLFMGRPGLIAQRGANFVQQTADLFISIGARLDHGQTAFNHKNFAKNAKKVIVDIDPNEIEKMDFKVDCFVDFDAKEFIEEVFSNKDKKDKSLNIFEWKHPKWIKQCREWKEKYPVILPEYKNLKDKVNNYVLIDVLSNLMKPTDLLVPGSSGCSSEVTMQAFKVKKGLRVFNSEGLGSMGFGIPSAIGGCIASKKNTICLDGDGGFMMNIQELETVKRLNLPIKFFVLNNGGYVSIRNSQEKHFKSNFNASSEDTGVTLPKFQKIASSYNIKYYKLDNHNNIESNIQQILNEEGPVLCEVIMPHSQESFPRNSTYKKEDGTFISLPMEDLLPLLDRDEFNKNMSIIND